jgi:hypothetical protein
MRYADDLRTLWRLCGKKAYREKYHSDRSQQLSTGYESQISRNHGHSFQNIPPSILGQEFRRKAADAGVENATTGSVIVAPYYDRKSKMCYSNKLVDQGICHLEDSLGAHVLPPKDPLRLVF